MQLETELNTSENTSDSTVDSTADSPQIAQPFLIGLLAFMMATIVTMMTTSTQLHNWQRKRKDPSWNLAAAQVGLFCHWPAWATMSPAWISALRFWRWHVVNYARHTSPLARHLYNQICVALICPIRISHLPFAPAIR